MSMQPSMSNRDFQLRQQQTIAQPTSVEGVGYWSGNQIRVEFRPAPVHSGIVFVRSDLPGSPRIPATVDYRIEVPRRTNLVCQGATVEMVEHVLAALAGLKIDNCEVHVTAAEMPGLDGSCQGYVDALTAAGTEVQGEPRPTIVIAEPLRVGNEESWVEIQPRSKPNLKFKYRLDFGPSGLIGRETLEGKFTEHYFREQLAPARTFILQAEAEWLKSQGMGTHVTYQDILVFGDEGPIDNPLRFEDECVRHKVLDLLGDLALAGCDLIGYVVAHRSGHRLNAELVRQVLKENQIVEFARRTA